MILDPEQAKARIARRVAAELREGNVVNLGIGLPTAVADYIGDGIHVAFQSENGMVGMGGRPAAGNGDPYIVDAGGNGSSIEAFGAIFDSAFSFGLIRGGHVDVCVLGALQVDQEGNLANWIVPGKLVPGMGGAMDLVTGSRRVIVAMQHTAKGQRKILKSCTLPLTAVHVVDLIVTELGVFSFDSGELTLEEIAEDTTVEEIRAQTEASFVVSPKLKPMEARGA
jgi:acetate CoA/acetoacetate CoA-transferase beta subunit